MARPRKTGIKELKDYLRISHNYEDALLTALYEAGTEYLTNAGVAESDAPLYRLARMLYAAIHYEHRDGSVKMEGFSRGLESIILQLAQAAPDDV